MRVKTQVNVFRILRIYIFLLVSQVAFPNTAYAFLSSLDACAANPECASVLGAELAPSVAAPTAAGSASTISVTTATGASTTIEAASGVAVVGDMRLSGVAAFYIWNQAQNQQAQDLAQKKYCTANSNDAVCLPPFTGGQGSDVPYNITFEAWTTNRNEQWYPHTVFTTHYGFHEPGGSNDLVVGPVHAVDVLRQLSMDGTYPRMCYGVIDKYGLRCFYEYSNTRYYGTDDYRFKFVSLAPLYQPDDNYGNPPPLSWKDWPQEKRDAAVKLISPSDWQVSIPYMPQGGTLKPGDIIDALRSFIPGQKKDNPNTPEDERQSKILPGPYTSTGSLPFALPSPSPTQEAPLAPTIEADRPVYPKTTARNTLKQEGKNKLAQGQGDQQGCFAVYWDELGRSQREKAFINYLTGRPEAFFVISKSGEIATFDGRQPGTNVVVELKDPRNETANYVTTLKQSKLMEWDNQRARELRVANTCGYQLIGVTSNQYLTNFLNARWKQKPPFFYVQTPAQVKKFAYNIQVSPVASLQTITTGTFSQASKGLSQLVAAKPQAPK